MEFAKNEFIKWMKNQKQRYDDSKTYSDVSINAMVYKLEHGMSLLNKHNLFDKYQDTYDGINLRYLNCFDILDSQTFSMICNYTMELAEVLDKKEGHSDFRNGLYFYNEFLNEKNINNSKLKKLIDAYNSNFVQIMKDEEYKWKAISHYRKVWDINANDFSSMLENAFSKADNLLSSMNYFPLKGLKMCVKYSPETVREAFRILYDEKLTLDNRIIKFKNIFDKYYEGTNLNHYQDARAISVYLTFEYPDKYSIYKYSLMKKYLSIIKGEDKIIGSDYDKIVKNNQLIDEILFYVNNNKHLQSKAMTILGVYKNINDYYRLLAQDVLWYSSIYEIDEYEEYWPSKEEYDPKLTVQQWQNFLEEDRKEYPSTLLMLKTMLENDEEMTCKSLALKLGGAPSSWISRTVSLGKRVKKAFNLSSFIDSNGKEVFFIIPFVGRYVTEDNKKLYSWRIRKELKEALQNMDLSDIGINQKFEQNNMDKNIILYGTPGTGKTYNTVIYAVSIIENKPLEDIKLESKQFYDFVLYRYNQYKEKGLIEFTTFHQSFGYEEFIEGIKPVMNDDSKDVKYEIKDGIFKAFCNKETENNKVFIIDEINRGNISKILGELITLIEPSKRLGEKEEITAKLPYSLEPFGVPNNVYIIGTMNTADRSIASIDTALRRRFSFVEMLPDENLLDNVVVEGLEIKELLKKMNERIAVLYDREHTIGHAYFMSLKDNASIKELANIFENKIIPLLQEYFFEDYEKIRLVLGDNQKNNKELEFIVSDDINVTKLFGNSDYDFDGIKKYSINKQALLNIEAYKI